MILLMFVHCPYRYTSSKYKNTENSYRTKWYRTDILVSQEAYPGNGQGQLWSWLYGSWIYNYLCNQCLSPLKLWFRTPFMSMRTRYIILWLSLSVTCGRSVDFSGYSGFHFQQSWPPRYNWNIVESGVKHHNSNATLRIHYCIHFRYNIEISALQIGILLDSVC